MDDEAEEGTFDVNAVKGIVTKVRDSVKLWSPWQEADFSCLDLGGCCCCFYAASALPLAARHSSLTEAALGAGAAVRNGSSCSDAWRPFAIASR